MKKVLGLILAAMMLAAVPCAAFAPQADADSVQTAVLSNEQTGTIVNCKVSCNVREKASSNSRLLGTAKKGETYTVLGTSGDWVKIEYTSDKDGYVYKTYIRIDEGVPTDKPVEGKVGKIVNCKVSCNVRKQATSDSKFLGTAEKGKVFKVLATAGDWVKIKYTSDTDGYVYKTYIKVTDEEEEIETEGKFGKIVNCRKCVNVREKASDSAKIIGKAYKGETFDVLDSSGKWIKVDYNGKTGYIYHTYVKLISESEFVKGRTAKIVDEAAVRESAKRQSTQLGTVEKNEIYRILGMSGDWYKIDFKGKTGYVYKTHVKVVGTSAEGKTVRIVKDARIREEAKRKSTLLGTAEKGEIFKVLAKSGDWYKIDFKGKTGYVYKTYVKIG